VKGANLEKWARGSA